MATRNQNNAVAAPKAVTSKGKVEAVKAPAYKYVALGTADADKQINAIRTKGATLRKLAHETAVGILMHYEATGDYTKINPLADAIQVAFNKAMFRGFQQWVIANSRLTLSQDQKSFVDSKSKSLRVKPEQMEQAKSKPFFDMSAANADPNPFDYMKTLQNLAKRVAKEVEEATGTVSGEDLVAINGLLKRAERSKAQKVLATENAGQEAGE